MTNTIQQTLVPPRVGTPTEIIASLPVSDYIDNFQPTYNEAELTQTVEDLRSIEAVTTPEHIAALKLRLGEIALGKDSSFIVIEGSCAEAVDLRVPIAELVDEACIRRDAVMDSRIGTNVLHIMRNRGQATKPRSAEFEELADGSALVSYMGDAVNSSDETAVARTPDPSRQIALAIQSRDLDAELTKRLGQHVPAAHEALLLSYEKSFVAEDAGKQFLLSADLPWIGMRTNQLDSEHVALLSRVENSVGIKIGKTSTTEHIAELNQALNPHGEDGKLVFMLRVGKQNEQHIRDLLQAIKALPNKAIVMYDIHGVTKSRNGHKIRAVPEIIEEINHLDELCVEAGLRLHGVHLETMGDNNHTECVDVVTDTPSRPGFVDPRLNPRQLTQILNTIH